MPKQKLHTIFLLLAFAGYIWLYVNYRHDFGNNNDFTLCLFKNITGIPCPSCGITRSLTFLIQGNIREAFYINPLGIVAAFALVIFPVWIVGDILLKKDTFIPFYHSMEKLFRKTWVAIPAITLVLLIWLTNLHKSL